MGSLGIKRIYDAAAPTDEYRVLVDRLWPRGESKQSANLDEWLKDIAPSPRLRTWWNRDSAKLEEFRRRYDSELDANTQAVHRLFTLAGAHDTVTLLYAARDPHINHARVLEDYMRTRFGVGTDLNKDAVQTCGRASRRLDIRRNGFRWQS